MIYPVCIIKEGLFKRKIWILEKDFRTFGILSFENSGGNGVFEFWRILEEMEAEVFITFGDLDLLSVWFSFEKEWDLQGATRGQK